MPKEPSLLGAKAPYIALALGVMAMATWRCFPAPLASPALQAVVAQTGVEPPILPNEPMSVLAQSVSCVLGAMSLYCTLAIASRKFMP